MAGKGANLLMARLSTSCNELRTCSVELSFGCAIISVYRCAYNQMFETLMNGTPPVIFLPRGTTGAPKTSTCCRSLASKPQKSSIEIDHFYCFKDPPNPVESIHFIMIALNLLFVLLLSLLSVTSAWILPSARSSSTTALKMVSSPPKPKKKSKVPGFGRNYEPKWVKQETLAEKLVKEGVNTVSPTDVGLVGTVPVVFKQGNVTKTTMAIVGQPLSEVATQAGQFIKYGCGKGECGTCESLCNGKFIRP